MASWVVGILGAFILAAVFATLYVCSSDEDDIDYLG